LGSTSAIFGTIRFRKQLSSACPVSSWADLGREGKRLKNLLADLGREVKRLKSLFPDLGRGKERWSQTEREEYPDENPEFTLRTRIRKDPPCMASFRDPPGPDSD
jgi:hypothetical protein